MSPAYCVCGDPAWQDEDGEAALFYCGKPRCRQCWLELKLGIIPQFRSPRAGSHGSPDDDMSPSQENAVRILEDWSDENTPCCA